MVPAGSRSAPHCPVCRGTGRRSNTSRSPDRIGMPEFYRQKQTAVAAVTYKHIAHAIQSGVKIAFGTDAAVYPHGLNGKQFAVYVKLGMTPVQAIQSATIAAADLFGWTTKAGTIDPHGQAVYHKAFRLEGGD